MNIILWCLQILLALHTVAGAVWKFSHTAAQTMPSLKAIPDPAWLTLSGLEFLFALALILPLFKKSFGYLAPLASACIAGEMALYSVLHLSAGATDRKPLFYWLVVAAVCVFITYGRAVLRPIRVEKTLK